MSMCKYVNFDAPTGRIFWRLISYWEIKYSKFWDVWKWRAGGEDTLKKTDQSMLIVQEQICSEGYVERILLLKVRLTMSQIKTYSCRFSRGARRCTQEWNIIYLRSYWRHVFEWERFLPITVGGCQGVVWTFYGSAVLNLLGSITGRDLGNEVPFTWFLLKIWRRKV